MKILPLLCLLFLTLTGCATNSAPWAQSDILTLKKNGGWNWFTNPRLLAENDRIIFSSVAGTTKDGSTAGDVQVTTFDLKTLSAKTSTLDPAVAADDHLLPSLLKRPDGRYLAVWQHHDVDNLVRWVISTNPNDATSWQSLATFPANTADTLGVTFTHTFQLPAENGRIYTFIRGAGFDPNFIVSDDQGATFRYGGKLLEWQNPEGKGQGRPYPVYLSNGRDTIWVITTEDHPKDFNNGIWVGYIRGGQLHRSDGTVAGPIGRAADPPPKPTDLTPAFRGAPDAVAYVNDVQFSAAARTRPQSMDAQTKLALVTHPNIVFSVRKDAAGTDIRYWYARWIGSEAAGKWDAHEIAHAGSTIYAEESSYAGLAALDPGDANTLFLSANADPKTGKPLISKADGKRHFEIFRGTTTNQGKTWSFTQMTLNSHDDNIRPLIVRTPSGKRAVLWTRGTMTTYKNYALDIVGVIE